MKDTPGVVIVLEGGLIKKIISTCNLSVLCLDSDIEGTDDHELTEHKVFGDKKLFFSHIINVVKSATVVRRLFKEFWNNLY